jgi:glycosyltransferase involved in cell wall biosynthesis
VRVLLVSSRHPLPPWRGNQVRTLQWIRALDDHEITLLCPESERSVNDPPACRVVTWPVHGGAVASGVIRAAVAGRPLQEGVYAVPQAVRAVRRLLVDEPWDLVVIQMVRCGWAADEIARLPTRPAVLFDAVDSMALHFRRAAEHEGTPRGWLDRVEASRCGRRELELATAADVTAAVCRRDVEAVGGPPERHVVVPVAADGPPMVPGPATDPVVVLTGNLGYRPTRTAVRWFADRVWPRVRRSVPEARWVIAGARPTADIRRLADRPGVQVRADVPDLARELSQARVAVAPMASGSGIPMKVIEAWAAGVSVVATPRAVWSLEGGSEACELRRRDDVDGWAKAIVELLTDDDKAHELSHRGRRAWAATYAPTPVAHAVRSAVTSAVARRGSWS